MPENTTRGVRFPSFSNPVVAVEYRMHALCEDARVALMSSMAKSKFSVHLVFWIMPALPSRHVSVGTRMSLSGILLELIPSKG